MNKIVMLIFFIFPVILFSADKNDKVENTVMVQLVSKNIKLSEESLDVIKGATEVVLTKSGYFLIDEDAQREALKEQADQRKKECVDESCLVDTGRMLAAFRIINIEVTQTDGKPKFTTIVIDVETGAKIATDFMWYKGNLDDSEQLDKDMRTFISKVLEIVPIKKKNGQNVVNTETDDSNQGDSQAVTIVKKDGGKSKEGKYKVTIKSYPTNAEIYDDVTGKYWGKTPFEAEMPEGSYTVSVEGLKDFDKAKRTFTVEGNVEFTLNMRSLKHKIGFIVDQSSVKIYVDGDYIGQTSYKANDVYYASVKEGERKIKIVKEKYKTIEEKINISSQQDFKFAMKENFSVLTLRSNPQGATVYLDGNQQDQTPIKLKLENGKDYKITLKYPDFKDYAEVVRINDDASKEMYLTKSVFDITIKTNIESKIFENGNLLGKSPLTYRFKEGKHTLKITSELPETVYELNAVRDDNVYIELKDKASFYINSNIYASLYLDGVYMSAGTSVYLSDVSYGKHTIKLEASDYKTIEEKITVSGNKNFDFKMEMTDAALNRKYNNYNSDKEGVFFGMNVFGVGKEYFENSKGEDDNQFTIFFMPHFKMGLHRSWISGSSYSGYDVARLTFSAEMMFGYPVIGYSFESLFHMGVSGWGISFGPKFIHYLDYSSSLESEYNNDTQQYETPESRTNKSLGLAINLFYQVEREMAFDFVHIFIGTNNTIFIMFNMYFHGYID